MCDQLIQIKTIDEVEQLDELTKQTLHNVRCIFADLNCKTDETIVRLERVKHEVDVLIDLLNEMRTFRIA